MSLFRIETCLVAPPASVPLVAVLPLLDRVAERL